MFTSWGLRGRIEPGAGERQLRDRASQLCEVCGVGFRVGDLGGHKPAVTTKRDAGDRGRARQLLRLRRIGALSRHRSYQGGITASGEIILFSGAIVSLFVALLAAIIDFGGLLTGNAATTAGHVYVIAMGVFVVSAIVAIFDLEMPDDIRPLFGRDARDTSER
jgi:uncharacterized membrane protein YtjA (UPF0391 family)